VDVELTSEEERVANLPELKNKSPRGKEKGEKLELLFNGSRGKQVSTLGRTPEKSINRGGSLRGKKNRHTTRDKGLTGF